MPRFRLPLPPVLLLATASLVRGCGDYVPNNVGLNGPHGRAKRAAEDNAVPRKACQAGDEHPHNRVDTSERLALLRGQFSRDDLSAFLVPTGDSHQSEYIAPADKRIQWISGFSGSSSFAVVTKDKAAFWADGRYLLQANDELDCNWLFSNGEEGGDTQWVDFLAQELPSNSRVGADPTLVGASVWLQWEAELEKKNLELVQMRRNLIDIVWTEDRPERNQEPLQIHPLEFAGRSWEDKISDVRDSLLQSGYDAIVISALDEVAWLFNLRGRDIPYNPVFRAYSIVSMDEIILYLPQEKWKDHVIDHLKAEGCSSSNSDCVQIRGYDSIFDELPDLSRKWNSVLLGKKWAYSGGASYALYRLIDKEKRKFDLSPVMLMKGRKNDVEIAGMQRAHVKDAVALIDFSALLDETMANGQEEWDEVKVDQVLSEKRREQEHSRGNSFGTISAYGEHGAVIHYKANEATKAKIGKDSVFLLDSGGQYLDGTTDVTRCYHFGAPTDFERDVYTRVLMGSVDLARATFPKGTPDTRLDILARYHLLRVGLNYRHGTGHGIGAYGFIHESPIQVRLYIREEHPFEVGQFFSDEPGYYQAGQFGVRLETILRVVERKGLLHQAKDDYGPMLGFEPVALVPFEPKLINYSMLSQGHVDWLNMYNGRIREKVGPELQAQGKNRGFQWMRERTEPITADFLRSYGVETNRGPITTVTGINLAIMLLGAALLRLLV